MLTINRHKQFLEICCVPCRLVIQYEPTLKIFDKKLKLEIETTEEEQTNEIIDKWNAYTKTIDRMALNQYISGYARGVEDEQNGCSYNFVEDSKK